MSRTPKTDVRGFVTYDEIATDYGHLITVKESSAARGPHCWLFIADGQGGTEPHLSLMQAIRLRDALNAFIDDVPTRWTDGAVMLDQARRDAYRRPEAEDA